jgi:hypothetical protein
MAITDRQTGFESALAIKAPCYVASTTNLALSSTQVIDGVTVSTGFRVLAKDQTDATENGIYICQSSSWARAPDFDGSRDAMPGTYVYVDRGSLYGGTFWLANSSATTTRITVGTDDISWSRVVLELVGISSYWQTVLLNTTALASRSDLGFPTTSVDNSLLRSNATAGVYQDSTWILGDGSTLTAGGPFLSSAINMGDALLTRPVVIDGAERAHTIGSVTATALALDYSSGHVFRFTVASSTDLAITVANPPASTNAGHLTLFITNGATQAIVWPEPTYWSGGSGPSLTTGLDIVELMTYSAGSTWFGFAVGTAFSTAS